MSLLFIVPVLSGCLCVWQIKRHFYKLELEQLAQHDGPEIKISSAKSLDKLDEFTPVVATGMFGNESALVGPRSVPLAHGPSVGYLVFTPLRLASGESILVNRGFVGNKSDPLRTPSAPVTLHAITRRGEPKNTFMQWAFPSSHPFYHAVEEDQMAEKLHALPQIIQLTDKNECSEIAPIPPPKIKNNHMQYAVTWFALSVTTTYMILSRKSLSKLARYKRL